MVNINCSLNCIHQVDGKCTLKSIISNTNSTYTPNEMCVYYSNTNYKN